jgi:hypothetical protein
VGIVINLCNKKVICMINYAVFIVTILYSDLQSAFKLLMQQIPGVEIDLKNHTLTAYVVLKPLEGHLHSQSIVYL